MNAVIRDAGKGDRAFIEQLGKRTSMDSVSPLRRPNAQAVVGSFERLLDIVYHREHVALIAEVAGEPAGFLLMLESLPDEVTGDDQAFIAYMAVAREHRGAGIGTSLLQRAEDEARRRGAPYIALMVTDDNAAARALYERAGFATERRLLCKTL